MRYPQPRAIARSSGLKCRLNLVEVVQIQPSEQTFVTDVVVERGVGLWNGQTESAKCGNNFGTISFTNSAGVFGEGDVQHALRGR